MTRMSIAALTRLVACVALTGRAEAQQSLTAPTVWVNELGSVMTINSISETGLVSGTYVTAAGCGAGVTRPLTGWSNLWAFTFTVNWQGCESLTSWTGNVGTSGTGALEIVTLWQLTVSGPPQWNSITAGADTFTSQ